MAQTNSEMAQAGYGLHHNTSHSSKEWSGDLETQCASCPAELSTPKESAFKSLGWLDRLLALWILLAMIVGVLLGNFVDSVGPALQRGKFVGVSIPIGMCSKGTLRAQRILLMSVIAIGLLVMMFPILCKVQFETLHRAFASRALWIQVGFSIILNWVIAPLVMVCRIYVSTVPKS